jgi:spore coat protein U-like protein
MRKVLYTVNVRIVTRAGTAVLAGAALVAGVAASASAGATNTFNVSTTINTACTLSDSGPTDLTPTYTPIRDSGTGTVTALNTVCNGTNPTVTFSDSLGSGTNLFAMHNGASTLYYQISIGASCSGVPGDNPIQENTPIALPAGVNAFDICAAVIAGDGTNVNAPAGTYSDTVTYTITP